MADFLPTPFPPIFHQTRHFLHHFPYFQIGCKSLLKIQNVELCLVFVLGPLMVEIYQSTLSQGCIFRLTCSHPELIEDHVLTSAYVKFFRTVTRNAVNKSVSGKKNCFWLPLNKHAMNIWLSSLRIRAHLSWRTGKHLHVLHVLRTYSTCSYPGY